MKRTLLILLSFWFCLTFVAGCGNPPPDDDFSESGTGTNESAQESTASDPPEVFPTDGYEPLNIATVSSGKQEIWPVGALLYSRVQSNAESEHVVKEGKGLADFWACIEDPKNQDWCVEVPRIVLDGELSFSLPFNYSLLQGHWIDIQNGYQIHEIEDYAQLSDLQKGEYYVVFRLESTGNCDPDAPQNTYRYEAIFRLTVGENYFSYVEDFNYYRDDLIDDWNFKNNKPLPCHTSDEAMVRAQNELSDRQLALFNGVNIAMDPVAKVWKIVFYTLPEDGMITLGGDLTVYLNFDGTTIAMCGGE